MVFFFNNTATTEIYTLSLHDALPIFPRRVEKSDFRAGRRAGRDRLASGTAALGAGCEQDRKSTRLNSSHSSISYAVFCLKKKRDHDQTRAEARHGLRVAWLPLLHTAW